jgi:uncharacterized protein YlaI|tara:strand:+ start:1013 stop:1177 length:165 start_codon:yes stop_codon:yes gene_type:complete
MNDKCINCGKETSVAEDTHVEKRKNYVIGAGQLCRVCHDTIYKEKENERVLEEY